MPRPTDYHDEDGQRVAWRSLGCGGSRRFHGYAVRGRSSSVFGESYYHGDRSRPALALTFDDGPSESTPKLLEALDKYRVPATFFMCGENVRRCPDVAREVAARGHELGNHTDSHPRLDFKSPRFIYSEMARAQETIQETTGAKPRWFRAPYGVRWFGVAQAQELLGLRGVMWTVIGRDWRWPAARVSERVLNSAANGGSSACMTAAACGPRRISEPPSKRWSTLFRGSRNADSNF